MAHFLKINDCDGVELYINLDMITEVNVEEREVTLANDEVYSFDDELNDSDWRHVMKFVNENRYY